MKFDLRIYVMVTSIDPLVAFVADEALVRFCTVINLPYLSQQEKYAKPSKENMHNLLSHLTNFSLNKLSDKFVNSADLKDQDTASKRTLTSIFEQMKREGVDTENLYEQIKETCAKALVSIQPFVLREQEAKVDMARARGDCF